MDPFTILLFLATLAAGVPVLAYFLVPTVAHALGVVAGTYLRKRTEGRRAQLLELMVSDEKAFQQAKESGRSSSDSNGWDHVEALSEKSAGGADKQASDSWSGIVGFFHPFW